MVTAILSIVVVLLLAYNAYVAYNVIVLVEKHGFRYFKLPFGKKVWKITEVQMLFDEDDYL